MKPENRKLLQEWVKLFVVKTGYRNIGTIEFLEAEGNFYFLEVNTRIQVEHPITEEATGTDIVKTQILIAAGEKLADKTYEPLFCSIESRVTGRTNGKINLLSLPGGPFVRIDTHIYSGYHFSNLYDPLLLKLITRGVDRESARRRMVSALKELRIEEIETNQEDLINIIESERFIKGNYQIEYNDSSSLQ
jgi:acetyl-CoA carboxylase biotin carboxylase subunit